MTDETIDAIFTQVLLILDGEHIFSVNRSYKDDAILAHEYTDDLSIARDVFIRVVSHCDKVSAEAKVKEDLQHCAKKFTAAWDKMYG